MENGIMVIPDTIEDAIKTVPDYFNLKRAIIYHGNKSTEHDFISGYFLCMAERQKIWLHDGSGAKGFFHWCENELLQKQSQVRRKMKIWLKYKHLIPQYAKEVFAVDFSKLALMAPCMDGLDEGKQLEMIHMAQHTPIRGLEDNVRELKGGAVATDVCMHDGPTKLIEVCKTCGKTLTITEVPYVSPAKARQAS